MRREAQVAGSAGRIGTAFAFARSSRPPIIHRLDKSIMGVSGTQTSKKLITAVGTPLAVTIDSGNVSEGCGACFC